MSDLARASPEGPLGCPRSGSRGRFRLGAVGSFFGKPSGCWKIEYEHFLEERVDAIGRPPEARNDNESARSAPRALGSLLLAATVIGSGIMAERLASGNTAVALLANTGATVAVLAVLIALLAPVSGAHFNPAVSLVQALRKVMPWSEAGAYVLVQIAGCCAGALLAHAMFELPLLQSSHHVRAGPAQWLSEAVATFGTAAGGSRTPTSAKHPLDGLPDGSGRPTGSPRPRRSPTRPFPSSRSFSDTFPRGIRPACPQDVHRASSLPRLVGALAGYYAARALFTPPIAYL